MIRSGLLLLAFLTGLAAGCARREANPFAAGSPVAVPLDARLSAFAAAHNARNVDALGDFVSKGARLQSPALPRSGDAAEYARSFLAEPFDMRISDTRILFSDGRSARTRSRVKMFAPGRFGVEERMDVRWVFEDGQWRIADIDFPDWPSVVGTWRRAGLRGENAIELRILPGGTYLVYAQRDRSVPTFRGAWSFENGALTLADTSSPSGAPLDRSTGTYAVIAGAASADFRLLADDNRWRSERYPGIWSAGR